MIWLLIRVPPRRSISRSSASTCEYVSAVQQRDPPVAKIVRAQVGDTCGRAGTRQRRAEAIGAEALEHAPFKDTIVARDELGSFVAAVGT